jgi:hypothetical protein
MEMKMAEGRAQLWRKRPTSVLLLQVHQPTQLLKMLPFIATIMTATHESLVQKQGWQDLPTFPDVDNNLPTQSGLFTPPLIPARI